MRFYPLSADLPTGEVLLLILLQTQFSIALKTSIVLTFISFRQATFPKGESKKIAIDAIYCDPKKRKNSPLLTLGKARKIAINAVYCDPKKRKISPLLPLREGLRCDIRPVRRRCPRTLRAFFQTFRVDARPK